MLQLKDIAAMMDGCHPRTAKRWWKKLDSECVRLGRPRVQPDVQGHGPHRWQPATAKRLIELWASYYNSRGTTPQLLRAKYAGDLMDARQLILTPIFNSHAQKTRQESHPQKKSASRATTARRRA